MLTGSDGRLGHGMRRKVVGRGSQRKRFVGLATLLAWAALPACSDLDSASDTYALSYNLQPELPPNWTCLNDPAPPPPQPTRASFTYTAFVPDYRTLMAVPVSSRACLITDFACETGVAQGVATPPPRPGLPPGFTVAVPATFEGFIRLSAPEYVPFDYYVGGPIVQDVVATQPFSMVSLTSLGEFISGLGADPVQASSLGVLALLVFDCNNDPAPDVNVVLADLEQRPTLQSAEPYAIQDRIPVPNRPTDQDGLAGFINLPIENVAVEGVIQGRRFGSRVIRIQPGRLTTGTIRADYSVGY
jgi:hypothetical protein